MHDVDAFEEAVSAYPAISVIRRGEQGESVVAEASARFGPSDADALVTWSRTERRRSVSTGRFTASTLPRWFPGDDLWPTGHPAALALVEDLNERFPPLEDRAVGTRISIGVATGADRVFVTQDPDLVEPERLLPLSMAQDTTTGTLRRPTHHLVNPWDAGRLVDLAAWPRPASYFRAQRVGREGRNIARRRPAQWYRTIDKVDADLTSREKLLFPDMKTTSHPVFDPGGRTRTTTCTSPCPTCGTSRCSAG